MCMKKCPICEKGNLKKGKIDEEMFGVALGRYDAEVCDKCGESFVDQKAMDQIERKAKELGIWGMARKLKIARSGNSLVVRIPADIARFLDLSEGEDVLLHPEGKKKIVLELT